MRSLASSPKVFSGSPKNFTGPLKICPGIRGHQVFFLYWPRREGKICNWSKKLPGFFPTPFCPGRGRLFSSPWLPRLFAGKSCSEG
jgi:hypothetical protein